LFSTADDQESDWCNRIQSLNRRAIVEPAVCEKVSDIESKGRDVVKQALDRVGCWFVPTNRRDCDDKRFRPTEDESSEVPMALAGAIAWFRVAEFSVIGAWTAVVMDIDEIKIDDP
jgi:hypothetical protein